MLATKSSQFIKKGLRTELLKFGIYLSIPIFASQLFNNPELSQKVIEYYNYIEYPAEDNETTKLKEDLEDLRQNLETARRKRILMKEQLTKLNEKPVVIEEENRARWWHVGSWFGNGKSS